MPSDTVIMRVNKSSKRSGTDSVYVNQLAKKLEQSFLEEETEEEKELIQEITQNHSDTTSSDEEKKKSNLSIESMFKYLRNENGVNIYECTVSDCKQVRSQIILSCF